MSAVTREMILDIVRSEVGGVVKEVIESNLAASRSKEEAGWQQVAALLQASAKPVKAPNRGSQVGRLVMALAANRCDPDRASSWARKRWGDDDEVTKALAAGDGVAGGFLVPPDWSQEIIELLRPMARVRGLNPIIMPMPNGTLTLPAQAAGSTASYIGENTNIGKTEPSFGQRILTYKKLAALVPVSNDMIRYASPGSEGIVRDDLAASLATREDLAFIRDDGSQYTPRGLRYWAPAGQVTAANGTVNLANVTTDLGKLVLFLENANVRMIRPGWIFSPRTKQYLMTVRDANGNFAYREEMMRGLLWGWPYGSTTQVPSNLGGGSNESEVYLVDFADAVIGEAASLIIDSSTEAAYHDGSNVVAAYSLDQTVVRAIAQHDFAVRHTESVAVLTTVLWTP